MKANPALNDLFEICRETLLQNGHEKHSENILLLSKIPGRTIEEIGIKKIDPGSIRPNLPCRDFYIE